MSSVQDTIRRAYLLLLGLFFHGLLIAALRHGEAPRLFGTYTDRITMGALGMYLLCGAAGVLLQRGRSKSRAGGWILAAASIVLAYYVVSFAVNWGVALCGIAFSLIQLHVLLTPEEELLSEGGRQGRIMGDQWTDPIILASLASLAVVLVIWGHGLVTATWGLGCGIVVVLMTLTVSLLYERDSYPLLRHRVPRTAHIVLLGALVLGAFPALRPAVFPVLALRQLLVTVRLWLDKRGGNQLWQYLTTRPPTLLVGGFALVVLVGTALLALPAADANGDGLAAVDALFTATSATCVTGLIVVDTGSDLTIFGQLIVLGLIQAGGLGIMTISTFIALMLGRNIGLRAESAIRETVTETSSRGALRLVKFIIGATVLVEFLGAVWLVIWWGPSESWVQRIYQSVFHSISAFCNAGFSLFHDSLMGFGDRLAVPLGVSVLIILGGLGFSVLFYALTFSKKSYQTLHVRMVLLTSAGLLVGGTVVLCCLEWGGVFAHDSGGVALMHAWFQSVTARTAGFNTVDMAELGLVSQLFLMFLMFIGGAPGSTAGGIKVTTFAILLLVIRAVLTGRSNVIFRGRCIETTTVVSATALAMLSAMAVAVTVCLLILTHALPARDLAFETVSAFGTVGLSTGITGMLNPFGKLAITVLMFLGRLGPLTMLVIMRPTRPPRYDYPSANVMVG